MTLFRRFAAPAVTRLPWPRQCAAMKPHPLIALALAAAAAGAAAAPLEPCRLRGVEHDALCGQVSRPLDPARPDGPTIAVHFAVLPALARNKKPDPVLFFAGGPGQSAIELAGPMSRLLARLSNRRDLVFIDQRGTGRSAPLACDLPDPAQPLRESADPEAQFARLDACRQVLQALPHGDLRQYTTDIAMADADAVRQALGAEQVNLVGGSYGTRAARAYQRLFPQAVRRSVIDGVAPPDMVLPATFSRDGQAAFDALVDDCAQSPACSAHYPGLRERWRAMLATLPREIALRHPITGVEERLTMTRDMAANLLRLPLYVPALTSALPLAITEAAEGRFGALVGLSMAMASPRPSAQLAEGMHFSVVCAEDVPRLDVAADAPGPDLGDSFAQLYRRVCADWPRGTVAESFYTMPTTDAPTLVLSGGIDPVTPPRHGERAAQALGAKARHVVVPNAGHGVMSLGCMRDVLFRFIDAETDADALAVDASCAVDIPRPPAFQPIRPPAARSVP
jgi:pimeloyl-ACP methyl ester carboxylesterase